MPWITPEQTPNWQLPHFASNHGVAQLAEVIARQKQQQQAQLMNAVASVGGTLGKALQERRSNQIADNLMQQQDPEAAARYRAAGLTGTAAADRLDQDQQEKRQQIQDELNNRYKEAQIGQMNQSGTDNGDPLGDQLKQLEIQRRQQELNQPGDPTVPTQIGGKTYNVPLTSYLTHVENQGVNKPLSPSMALSREVARGWTDKDGNFTNNPADMNLPSTTDAGQGPMVKLLTPEGKTLIANYDQYSARKRPVATPQDSATAPQPAPAETAQGNKALDRGTAAAILQEAGGDKDKARQLAIARGYSL